MFGKILLFIYIAGVSNAVFVDTSENTSKELVKMNPQAWQMVKVYHPPSQPFGYKYEPYAYPKYEFEYSVSDKKTGDHKHHHEARDGDEVRGEYSLVESDGSLRKVQYHADDHSGFNAIVSKTVNQHGDHAVSVSDHTRFFYPVGHNVKINHYFPGKDYQYQPKEVAAKDKASKPVHEETAGQKSENAEVVVIESGDKLMTAEPVQFVEQNKETAPKEEGVAPKPELVEVTPVQVVPAVLSVAQHNTEAAKAKVDSSNVAHSVEIVHTQELATPLEEPKNEKEEHSDAEVASSYYHSRFYYVY